MEYILFGNGAADLIFRLALAEKPKKAVVTAPTFAEYELALRTAGCEADRHMLSKTKDFRVTETLLGRVAPGIDMLFICNPNNPTGRTVDPGLMAEILAACEKTGTLLVVDECFNGFLDRPDTHSLKSRLPKHDNLLILDAFTKLYGMAGIRLGYCLSRNTKLLGNMKNAGQPWSSRRWLMQPARRAEGGTPTSRGAKARGDGTVASSGRAPNARRQAARRRGKFYLFPIRHPRLD
jgi:threonine-phosphate decarboxylase